MRRVLPRRGFMAAVLIAAGVLDLAGCDDRRQAARAGPGGEQAPELVALTLDGAPVRLEDLRGKVVLVNFWLAGCGPCLVEMPELDAYRRAHRDEGVEILAINMGQPDEVILEVRRRLGLTLPLLADPLEITTTRYNVLGAPTSFVIDPDGRLVERINGPLDRVALDEKLGRRL